jgi:hypothetical protein
MSVLDPKQDAAALQSVEDEVVDRITQRVMEQILPALQKAASDLLDGLTITVGKKAPNA